MRTRGRLFGTGQRQEASPPFTPHRQTGQSDTRRHGKRVGGAMFGATLSIETRNTSIYHLWRKL